MIQMTYKLPHLLAARSRSKCDIPNFNKSFNCLTPTQSIFHIINKGVARNILWGLFLSISLIYGDYFYFVRLEGSPSCPQGSGHPAPGMVNFEPSLASGFRQSMPE